MEKGYDRKGIAAEEANKRIQKVNSAFPDALVHNYKGLIENLKVPDAEDRHVMAAIKTNANVIVTNNVKDFPEEYLQSFGRNAHYLRNHRFSGSLKWQDE